MWLTFRQIIMIVVLFNVSRANWWYVYFQYIFKVYTKYMNALTYTYINRLKIVDFFVLKNKKYIKFKYKNIRNDFTFKNN